MNEKQIDEFTEIFGKDLSHYIQMSFSETPSNIVKLESRRQKTIDFLQKQDPLTATKCLNSILLLTFEVYKHFDLDSADAIRKVKLFMQQEEALI